MQNKTYKLTINTPMGLEIHYHNTHQEAWVLLIHYKEILETMECKIYHLRDGKWVEQMCV